MENNRYNNAKIYKLFEEETGYFYIGSTCQSLSKRYYTHKCDAIRQPERKVYKCYNSLGWENVKITLIEEHFLDNKEQLLREENRVIEMYLNDEKCLNSKRAIFNEEEYKKEQNIKHKIYNKNNPERYKQWNHTYYEKNKDKLKNYYDENRESVLQRMNERYICGCGAENSHCNRRRHERSKKHQTWLKDQQQTAETI